MLDAANQKRKVKLDRLSVFQNFLSGWTANSVPKSFEFSTNCTNGVCDFEMPGGVVVKSGAGEAVFMARVENSQLTVDKELSLLAAKRGIKFGERGALSKLLLRMELIGGPDKSFCKELASGKIDDGSVAGGIGRNEMRLVETMNSAPAMTAQFVKEVLNLRDGVYTVEMYKADCQEESPTAAVEPAAPAVTPGTRVAERAGHL